LYNIFIVEKEKEYLTTLDIQTHLVERGIDLSKKEINAWLRSLQDADLITKEPERGKPTTIAYDDKYTFDKWSLTEKGLTVSEGLMELISETLKPDERLFFDSTVPSEDDVVKQTDILQDWFLAKLRRSNGKMQLNDLIKKLVPGDAEIDTALSALIKQGLIDVRESGDVGFLTRVLVILGLKTRNKEVVLT
jgi:predicted transcriptional regulator